MQRYLHTPMFFFWIFQDPINFVPSICTVHNRYQNKCFFNITVFIIRFSSKVFLFTFPVPGFVAFPWLYMFGWELFVFISVVGEIGYIGPHLVWDWSIVIDILLIDYGCCWTYYLFLLRKIPVFLGPCWLLRQFYHLMKFILSDFKVAERNDVMDNIVVSCG